MSRSPKEPAILDLATISGEFPEESRAQSAERKRISARCGHVKRRLVRNEPLKGDLLEFALDIAGKNGEIAAKLKAGQQLTAYELYLMLDVFLLRARLSAPKFAD